MHPRRKPHLHPAIPLAAFALLPATALAHPIDVLRDSTEIYLGNGSVERDGDTARVTGHLATKSAGTLSLALPLSIAGLDTSDTLILTGTRQGDEVWWDFDQPLSISVDDFSSTNRIEGRLITRVTDLPASSSPGCGPGPCPYSLYLDGVDRGSWVRVHGTTTFIPWQEEANLDFELFSGPLRPQLDALHVARVGRICESDVSRRYDIEVTLDNEATPRGTLVELGSNDPSVRVARQALVAAGQRRTNVSFEIPNAYSGEFTISAAVGGIQLSRTVTVGQSLYCLAPDLDFALDDLESDLNCRGCLDDLQLAGDGMALGSMFGTTYLRESDGFVVNLEDIAGLSFNSPLLGHSGDITVIPDQYDDFAVILERQGLDYQPYAVENFVPRHIDSRGVIFGDAWGGNSNLPAYLLRGDVIIPDYGFEEGTINGGPSGGVIVGQRDNNGTMVPFFASPQEAWPAKFLKKKAGAIVGFNATGQFAGNVIAKGRVWAYFATDNTTKPTVLKHPDGLHSEAIGMDESGNVVVNLTSPSGEPQGAAIYNQQTGFTSLQEFVGQQQAFIEVHEVVSVNAAFDMTIRGTIDGEDAMFGLRNLPIEQQGGLQ